MKMSIFPLRFQKESVPLSKAVLDSEFVYLSLRTVIFNSPSLSYWPLVRRFKDRGFTFYLLRSFKLSWF